MLEKEILELFKVMVVTEKSDTVDLTNVQNGFITNFVPTPEQLIALKDAFKPLDMITLFTVEEREHGDVFDLLQKQILHYIEVYGLNVPGLFDLEVNTGKVAVVAYVKGVTSDELSDSVLKLLYSNAPVKDAAVIKQIVETYQVNYDINEVRNNELRVLLFDVNRDKFSSGDDAVRYMCFRVTASSMLIKSPKVISQVETNASIFSNAFFEKHLVELAQVFNRHKRIIIAAKTKANRTVINKITRLSKTLHVPLQEGINKRFVRLALTGKISDYSVLDKMSVRDKFKFLNLLEYKKAQHARDAFVIRNGKVHLEENRPVYDIETINKVIGQVLNSLVKNLVHLRGSTIVLDPNVDYGLPISRKQTIGNLPFGTAVTVKGSTISSGVYWHNDGGARDLDLSTVDTDGNRTGWGQMSGYDSSYNITYSGDLTDARNGAMEFMTSSAKMTKPYGLFINIFNGKTGCSMELVIGTKTEGQWIKDALVREKHKLDSTGSILGFVRGNKFVVYTARLSNDRVSRSLKNRAIVSRGTSEFWTVKRLLNALHIKYVETADASADHNLDYSSFSYDKLETLLIAN